MSTLPLPATRLAGSVAPDVLVEEMAALVGPLARRVQKAREEEDEDGAAADD